MIRQQNLDQHLYREKMRQQRSAPKVRNDQRRTSSCQRRPQAGPPITSSPAAAGAAVVVVLRIGLFAFCRSAGLQALPDPDRQ